MPTQPRSHESAKPTAPVKPHEKPHEKPAEATHEETEPDAPGFLPRAAVMPSPLSAKGPHTVGSDNVTGLKRTTPQPVGVPEDAAPEGLIVEKGKGVDLPTKLFDGVQTFETDVWERKVPAGSKRPVYLLVGRKGQPVSPVLAKTWKAGGKR